MKTASATVPPPAEFALPTDPDQELADLPTEVPKVTPPTPPCAPTPVVPEPATAAPERDARQFGADRDDFYPTELKVTPGSPRT